MEKFEPSDNLYKPRGDFMDYEELGIMGRELQQTLRVLVKDQEGRWERQYPEIEGEIYDEWSGEADLLLPEPDTMTIVSFAVNEDEYGQVFRVNEKTFKTDQPSESYEEISTEEERPAMEKDYYVRVDTETGEPTQFDYRLAYDSPASKMPLSWDQDEQVMHLDKSAQAFGTYEIRALRALIENIRLSTAS